MFSRISYGSGNCFRTVSDTVLPRIISRNFIVADRGKNSQEEIPGENASGRMPQCLLPSAVMARDGWSLRTPYSVAPYWDA
jgi:hypothetical protein